MPVTSWNSILMMTRLHLVCVGVVLVSLYRMVDGDRCSSSKASGCNCPTHLYVIHTRRGKLCIQRNSWWCSEQRPFQSRHASARQSYQYICKRMVFNEGVSLTIIFHFGLNQSDGFQWRGISQTIFFHFNHWTFSLVVAWIFIKSIIGRFRPQLWLMHPSPTYPMRLLISLLVFTLVRPTALALVPTRMARHPKRVCSPQQPQAGSIEMAGWMCKSKNGNGNCNSDEDDDIADMLYTMKITSEEIKGKITILKEHIENNENKRIN